MMFGPLELVAAPIVGLLVWHETRVYGRRIDDKEWVEAAPVIAGVAIAIGFGLSAEIDLLQPVVYNGALDAWDIRKWAWGNGVMYGTITMMGLVLLEAVLHDEDKIEQDWLLFEPLRFTEDDNE